MKNYSKLSIVVASLMVFSLLPSIAWGDEGRNKPEDNVAVSLGAANSNVNRDRSKGEDSNEEVSDDTGSTTSTDQEEESSEQGQQESERHRSRVSKIVRELTALAGKDKNIGEEISQVANGEATTTEEQTDLIKKVEGRNRFKTFLLGSDYKNLGSLRSTLVTTSNHLERLQRALQRVATSSPELAAQLNIQITALAQAKDQVESFIKANENKLSLFGWLVRLFNR